MIDLLGKRKLEEEIEELRRTIGELEKRRDALLQTVDKREAKIKKLTYAHQEVNRTLRAAEQKISALQAKAPAEETGEETGTVKARSHHLRPADLERLLDKLSTLRSSREDLVSAYLREETDVLPQEARDLADDVKGDRGLVILHCPLLFTLALVPPFPVKEAMTSEGRSFELAPLREMLETPVLVISAHAGETLLDVTLGSKELAERVVVKSTVKEKHSKGGWSQKRFERLRKEDIRQHADLVVDRLSPLVESYRPHLAYAVISGEPVLTKLIKPALDLPVVETKMARFGGKRADQVLDEVYGFVLVHKV